MTDNIIEFSPRHRVRHVTSFREMCTLTCSTCTHTYNAPNPLALRAKGVDVGGWHCPRCGADSASLGVVEGSARMAPPRG